MLKKSAEKEKNQQKSLDGPERSALSLVYGGQEKEYDRTKEEELKIGACGRMLRQEQGKHHHSDDGDGGEQEGIVDTVCTMAFVLGISDGNGE